MHSHHISVTDVCVTPSTLYPAHGGHRNAKSLQTIQDKRELSGWREGLGLCEWEWGSWGLRWGNFSPLIALCGTSPGGTLTAVEAGVYDVLSEKPLAKRPSTTDKNLTYCSKTMWEINNKSNFLPKKENKKQISNSLFISQDDYDLL